MFGSVLVTGATGLLGSELTTQILKHGEASRVICLVRDHVPWSRFYAEGLDKKVIVVDGDIRDQKLLLRILNEYEVQTVFHLAAQTLVEQANRSPEETFDVNIRGTWMLLEAVRLSPLVKSTIIASSDKAYGNLEGGAYDESFALSGRFPYDVSKSCADLLTQSYAHSFGLNVSVTRCGNFFGPGDLNESRLFPSTILSLLKKQSPLIRSDGTNIRDYLYVADAASAYRLLARHQLNGKSPGSVYNFSYGLRLTVLDVVERITKAMGSALKPTVLSRAKNEIPVQCLDSTKARTELGWQPEFGFEKGLLHTIDWYQHHFAEMGLLNKCFRSEKYELGSETRKR